MRKYRFTAVLLLSAVMVSGLTGCSYAGFKEAWRTVLDKGDKTVMSDKEMQKMKDEKVVRLVDESMAAPEFSLNLGDSYTYQVGASADTLEVSADSEEGEITYQWYSSTAETNGGGKAIDGATESTYIPDTSEKGTYYYYCVATATVDNRIREATSYTATITVEDAEDVSVLSGEGLK